MWTCSRPLVYRALALLVERGLVEERGSQPSEAGPQRTMLGVTRAGRRELYRWLGEPAAHVRDIRSALMLKLLFLSQRGADPSELLERQRAVLASVVDGLEAAAGDAEDFDRILYLWRLESARAALRFVDDLLSGAARGASPSP